MHEAVHEEYRRRAGHWWFRARRDIFSRLLDACVDLPPSAEILDVGPGSGINLGMLTPRGRVTVLDRDRGSLLACRGDDAPTLRDAEPAEPAEPAETAEPPGAPGAPAILPVQGDATEPPFAAGSFDLVCALDVIEHLDDDARALAGMRRLLKPDGRLLLSVPALPILWGRQDLASDHRRRYVKRELRSRLWDAGFAILKLSYFNTLLLPPILCVRLAMRPFLNASARRGTSDLSVRAPLGLDLVLYRLFAAEARWLARRDLPIGVSLVALARPREPWPQRELPPSG